MKGYVNGKVVDEVEYMEDMERKKGVIDIWTCKFRCNCGHEFRATYTKNYKTFMPRKCEKCGTINKEGLIIKV